MESSPIIVGEYIVDSPEYVPDPAMLRKIASTAMLIAHRTNAFVENRVNSAKYWVDASIDYTGGGQKEYSLTSGRFERRARDGVWSLKYRQLGQSGTIEDGWYRGALVEHRFEWDDQRVLVSDRRTAVVPSIEQGEIDATLDYARDLLVSGSAVDEGMLYRILTQQDSPTLRNKELMTWEMSGEFLAELRQRRDEVERRRREEAVRPAQEAA